MSMHLLGPWVTSTVYNRKRRKKKVSAKEQQLRLAHQKYIKKLGYKPTGQSYRHEFPDYGTDDNSTPTSDRIVPFHGGKKERQVYTGDLLVGIGTLHKSNMVPVSKNSSDAKDIAKMRR